MRSMRSGLMVAVVLSLVWWGTAPLMVPGAAQAQTTEQWLSPWGAGKLQWGTTSQPFDVLPKKRDLFLPDARYVGTRPSDRPQDYELPGPHAGGERRFLRYVDGKLVDAWLMRTGPIDVSGFEYAGDLEWTGVVLGPSEAGFRAYGQAHSYFLGDKTALHWKDRATDLEILAVRARPTGQYAVRRARPLEPGVDNRFGSTLKGELRKWAKPYAAKLGGCLNEAVKPVELSVEIHFDKGGRPARIKSDTDRAASGLDECVAAALVASSGLPASSGSFKVFRLR